MKGEQDFSIAVDGFQVGADKGLWLLGEVSYGMRG